MSRRTIQVAFIGGLWHGLYRTIPVEQYVTPQGLNYSLFLDVKRVNGRKRSAHFKLRDLPAANAITAAS